MPLLVQNIAAAMGDTLTYGVSDPGGYTFAQHSAYAPTLSLIFSQPWDIVVLQEQSEMPAFPPAEVDTEVYPYAHILDSMIHANDSCTQTMFLMTWGHANGDPPNCASYPVICTYAGMQQRLHDSYLEMTQLNNAIVAPVGVAWQVMMDSFAPGIWLYIPDSSHPDLSGSFLEASVVYSSIFHKRTLGGTYNPGIPAADATTIQRIADKVTMDSLYQWQQYGHYPAAVIADSCAGGYSRYFSSASGLSGHDTWDYGDATTDTVNNSLHVYPSIAQSYTLSLTASNSCFSETQSATVDLPCYPTKVAIDPAMRFLNIANTAGQRVLFSLTSGSGDLEVFSAQGLLIASFREFRGDAELTLVPGLYVARFHDQASGRSDIHKFVVY